MPKADVASLPVSATILGRQVPFVSIRGIELLNACSSVRRVAVCVLAALRTYNFGILIGHFVQEGGKCLTTVFAQQINRVWTHNLFSPNRGPTSTVSAASPLAGSLCGRPMCFPAIRKIITIRTSNAATPRVTLHNRRPVRECLFFPKRGALP
jgi:hypothetical protein